MSARPLVRIAAVADPPKGWLIAGVLLGVGAVGAGIGLMAASGYLISRAALQPPILELSMIVVAVRFFGLARGVFRYGERLVSHDATLRAIVRLRVAVFRRLEPLVPTDIAGLRTGDLLQRFVADVDAQQNLALRIAGPLAVAVGAGVLAVGVAAVVLPASAVVLAVGLLVAGGGLPWVTSRLVQRAAQREAPERAELGEQLLDAIDASAELVAFGRAEAAHQGVVQAGDALARTRRRLALTAAAGEGGMTALTLLTTVAVIAVAVPAVTDGNLAGVKLALLALLALASFEAVRPLPAAAEQLRTCQAAAARVLDVIDREPSITDPRDPVPAPVGSTFALRAVRFRYADHAPWVLDGADLELQAGTITALTGPSGVGKSTIAALFQRFRDPSSGTVTIDGIDLRELQQTDVRQLVASAGQDAHLFPVSIRENLLIGDPAAADSDLMRALERARARTWVEGLPDGLATRITERGGNISGGQRQRIALARALLARPRLLILDEPTAHLDPATAKPLLRDLIAAARDGNLAVLLITHDRIDPELVDHIATLRDGCVAP